MRARPWQIVSGTTKPILTMTQHDVADARQDAAQEGQRGPPVTRLARRDADVDVVRDAHARSRGNGNQMGDEQNRLHPCAALPWPVSGCACSRLDF